jgi:uncharacterized protein (DUF885 family)
MIRRSLLTIPMILVTACAPEKPQEPFATLAEEFVYESLAASPVSATQAGYHKHGGRNLDNEMDDYSPAALDRQRRWYQDLRLRLARASDAKGLSPEDRADLDIIHNSISLALLELQSIQNYRHNPTLYVETIGNAIYAPFTLEYTDKNTRFQHIIERLKRVPAFLTQAQLNLTSAPDIWTSVAIGENEGNVSLIDQEIREQVPEHLRAEYEAAARPALESVRRFTRFLQQGLPGYDWRLGGNKYAQKFRYALGTDQSPDEILQAAESRMRAIHNEMYGIAATLTKSTSRDRSAVIRQALNQIAQKHATRETYFADARRDLQEAREFVRAKDLLTLPPRDNLQVIETPEFMRGIYSVGGFSSAPALEPQLGAFYWLTPIPADWPTERIESKLREYNTYGLKILTIHEAMPGHYVQLEYANEVQPQLRRILRSIYGSGPYIEGWAVYATEVTLEQGYMNHDPEMRISYLKHLLRVIANTILDVRLQTKSMTDQEALTLMTDDAFQEREEATGKLQRAKLSSAQLPTYFVGYYDWMRLRSRMQAKQGASFNLKQFHETALAAGALPLPVLARLLTGKSL